MWLWIGHCLYLITYPLLCCVPVHMHTHTHTCTHRQREFGNNCPQKGKVRQYLFLHLHFLSLNGNELKKRRIWKILSLPLSVFHFSEPQGCITFSSIQKNKRKCQPHNQIIYIKAHWCLWRADWIIYDLLETRLGTAITRFFMKTVDKARQGHLGK